MAVHRTIDPEKAVRWERSATRKVLLLRLGVAAALVVLGLAVRSVVESSKAGTVEVMGAVMEPPSLDGQASVRYTDPKGAVHVRRVGVGGAGKDATVRLALPEDDYDAPKLAGGLRRQALDLAPWLVVAVGVVVLLTVPAVVVRLEKVRRAKRLLGTEARTATFDWFRREDGRRQFSAARIVPDDNVWGDKTVQLGKDKPPIDQSVKHQVQVWGDARGNEPMIVVGESWAYVVIR